MRDVIYSNVDSPHLLVIRCLLVSSLQLKHPSIVVSFLSISLDIAFGLRAEHPTNGGVEAGACSRGSTRRAANAGDAC